MINILLARLMPIMPPITVSEASRLFLIRKPRLFFFSPVFLLSGLTAQQEQASGVHRIQ